jgi:hypothetical protein
LRGRDKICLDPEVHEPGNGSLMAARDRKDHKERQEGKTIALSKGWLRESVQGLVCFAFCAFFRG